MVDDEKCINCGLCRKTCPSLDMQNLHSTYPDPYLGKINDILVGRCADEQLFVNAQSGGACSATVSYLFRTGKIDAAIVCGWMRRGIPRGECQADNRHRGFEGDTKIMLYAGGYVIDI